MGLSQRKIQKIFDKQKLANYIDIEKTASSQKCFVLNSPFLDNMDDTISLTLYLQNPKSKYKYLLSDDGFSFMNCCPDGLKGIKDKFLRSYIQHTDNLSTATPKKILHECYDPKNDAFEIKFNNIKDAPTAYHYLIETILSFQAIFDFRFKQKAYMDKQKKVDTKSWSDLHKEVQAHPEEANHDFYQNEKDERDNGLRLLDNIEGLIKIKATRAYVRTIKNQVQVANLFLSVFDHAKGFPSKTSIDDKQLADHLNKDESTFLKHFSNNQPELPNSTKD